MVSAVRTPPRWALVRSRPADRPARLRLHGAISFGVLMAGRHRARTAVAAIAVTLPVATLGFLATLQGGFHGQLSATLLGEEILLRARSVDVLSGLLLAALGLFTTAMVLWLGMLEDALDYAILHTQGWRPSRVLGALVAQAAVIAIIGSILGVALSAIAIGVLGIGQFAGLAHLIIAVAMIIITVLVGCWPAYTQRHIGLKQLLEGA